MSTELAPGVNLAQLPLDTTPLRALDDDALAAVFGQADRVAATSFLWACACIEELRARYAGRGPEWHQLLAERLQRSHSAIRFYAAVWRLYQSIRQEPALSPRLHLFVSLPRGVLTRLAQVKKASRLQAAGLVLDLAEQQHGVRPREVMRFLIGQGLLEPGGRKKFFGPPLNFRELRHEPINEQGVVYLFGMVARDLGFLVEGVAQGFPDCIAKRRISGNKYVAVRIEFEFRSTVFRLHKHDPAGCDLIVCWEHDWFDCPVEVLELKSAIERLDRKVEP